MKYYRQVPTCEKHPLKPANKLCWECKKPLCKLCGHEHNKHYYCDDCKPASNRGVITL